MKNWKGHVIEILDGYFIAHLYDLSKKEQDIEVEFSFDDVADNDKELLTVGAIFNWSVGCKITVERQKIRHSIIKFRRLVWTKKDLKNIDKKAGEFGDF